MEIKVIGSGSVWNEYNSACYMIDNHTLVDIPNGCCKNLFKMGIDPVDIDNVLITHFHGDHFFDMPFYMSLKSKVQNKEINVFCSEEGREKISNLLELAFPNSVARIEQDVSIRFDFNKKFVLDKYNINKILVDHGRMKPAYGYIVECDNKKAGFTGDTSLCASVEYMASKCNYLFCDCMFIKGTDKHMGIDNLKYLVENHPKCIFVPSHLNNETREELKYLNLKNVIIAEDGMEINI